MSTPPFCRAPARRRWFCRALAVACFGFSVSWLHAAKPQWQPISPDELAETAPQLEPDAPAEIAVWNIEIDDRRFPMERKTTEYIRYKIFAPDKVDNITRVSQFEFAGSLDRTELHARLVLPNGQVREFGKDAIKERPLVQQARQAGFFGWLNATSPAVVEKFLAVSGIERGAVLEFQITRTDRFPSAIGLTTAQREGIPVRRFEYRCRQSPDTDLFRHRTFVTNAQGAKLTEDRKAKTVSITASRLPAFKPEPMAGPATAQMLTILSCYEQLSMYLLPRSGKVPMPGTVEASSGPWAPYATLMNWVQRDRGLVTKRVKELAAELVNGAVDDVEKARRIHRHVAAEWQSYRQQQTPKVERRRVPSGLNEVIDWAKNPEVQLAAEEFLWLALSLYECGGLEARAILLPNREFARFDQDWVSPVFLPHLAAAIRINGAWKFAVPHHEQSLPFGMLPWQHEGQVGLLALAKQQEFIPVPELAAKNSVAALIGRLELQADGALKGEFARHLTGHLAVAPRAELRAAAEKDRNDVAKKWLGFDLKAMDITVTKIEGLDDAEQPLVISCELQWTDFAVRTKDRMIFRPAIFRSESTSPFTASERRRPVYFPYRWQEIDRISIRLPSGYVLESPAMPAPFESEALAYRMRAGLNKEKAELQLQRDFLSNVIGVGPAQYPILRDTYAYVARSDQHELVLARAATSGVAAAAGGEETEPAK